MRPAASRARAVALAPLGRAIGAEVLEGHIELFHLQGHPGDLALGALVSALQDGAFPVLDGFSAGFSESHGLLPFLAAFVPLGQLGVNLEGGPKSRILLQLRPQHAGEP